MNLQEATQEIESIKRDIAVIKANYRESLGDAEHDLKKAVERRELLVNDISLDKVALAETVVSAQGDPSEFRGGRDGHGAGVRDRAVEDAIRRFAEDPDALCKEYIGVKNYDSFGDQRCDGPYGMGPKHGNIVFAIRRVVRDRDLTSEETEAVLYYLLNIRKTHKAKQAAA